MDFRRPTHLKTRQCPVCGLEKATGLGGRCPEDGEILVAPDLLDEMLVGGRFRLVEPIGQGAFARVYAASDRQVPAASGLVAIKLLKPSMRRHQEALARFEREGDLLHRLTGARGVVGLAHRARTDAGDPFLALEYVDGQTLQDVLRTYVHLPPAVACRIVLAILEAVGAIHRLGIVHRDLKPSNIMMLSASDEIDLRLLDFGVAQSPDRNDQQLTMMHRTVGTPQYMSPELWHNSRVDLRSDLYAIGVIMYFMLVGTQPYVGETTQIANQHKTAPVPSIPVTGDMRPIMAEVVSRAMAKRPEHRYASAEEMYDALATGLGLPSLAEARAERGSDTLIEQLVDPNSPISLPSASSTARVTVDTIRSPRLDRRRLLRACAGLGLAGGLAWSFAALPTTAASSTEPVSVAALSEPRAPDWARLAGPEPVRLGAAGWWPSVARSSLTTWDGASPEAPGGDDQDDGDDAGSSADDEVCTTVRVRGACKIVDPITRECLEYAWTRKKRCKKK